MNKRLQYILGTVLFMVGCGTSTPQFVEEYVHCRSLEGDRTALKVFEWEFNAVAEAIESSCTPENELTEKQIIAAVSKRLKPELRDSIKDVKLSITTTLLELEVRGVFVKKTDGQDDESPKFRRAS